VAAARAFAVTPVSRTVAAGDVSARRRGRLNAREKRAA